MTKNVKEVRLVNIADCGVGLKDTYDKLYNLPVNGQLRITVESMRNILDEPVSKKMICEGLVKIEDVEEDMLVGTILDDEERNYILGDRIAPTVEAAPVKVVEVKEEKKEIEIVNSLVFYNWIKNNKEDKIREAIKNPVNYDTLCDIVEKSDKYETELVAKILKETQK